MTGECVTIWEYHQEVIAPPEATLRCCEQLGKDGWELAGILPAAVKPNVLAQPAPGVLLLFKRQKVSGIEIPA